MRDETKKIELASKKEFFMLDDLMMLLLIHLVYLNHGGTEITKIHGGDSAIRNTLVLLLCAPFLSGKNNTSINRFISQYSI